MSDPTLVSYMVRFGAFEVNLRSAELRKQGLKVKIQEQPFQVLAMLLECPGQVVTREVLGDSADNPRFVETLPRRGYRFIAPVEAMGAQGAAPVVAPVSPSPTETAVRHRRQSR